MSLYKCPECEQYFKLPEDHYTEIQRQCIESDGVGEQVCKCECGFMMVSGCEEVEENEYHMFSCDYNYLIHGNRNLFDAIMLIECDESEETDSTYEGRSILETGRTVHLKPKQ